MLSAIINKSNGTQEVVAGVAGKTIRVKAMFYVAAGTTTVTPKNATTALTGAMTTAAGVPQQFGPSTSSWMECAVGASFNFTVATAVQVSGRIIYRQD